MIFPRPFFIYQIEYILRGNCPIGKQRMVSSATENKRSIRSELSIIVLSYLLQSLRSEHYLKCSFTQFFLSFVTHVSDVWQYHTDHRLNGRTALLHTSSVVWTHHRGAVQGLAACALAEKRRLLQPAEKIPSWRNHRERGWRLERWRER